MNVEGNQVEEFFWYEGERGVWGLGGCVEIFDQGPRVWWMREVRKSWEKCCADRGYGFRFG